MKALIKMISNPRWWLCVIPLLALAVLIISVAVVMFITEMFVGKQEMYTKLRRVTLALTDVHDQVSDFVWRKK